MATQDPERSATASEVDAALRDLDLEPDRFPASTWPIAQEGLDRPGLYSWWVDQGGAADLASGTGHLIQRGRIYAGQAGATKWPSGTRSGATLCSRIDGFHLGGNIYGSTLRFTLASCLVTKLGLRPAGDKKLDSESEDVLTQWMRSHLDLAVHAFSDRDRLGDLEKRVLGQLDPPLCLSHVPRTPLRETVRAMRKLLRKGGSP